jgi:hypothetical protein
MYQLWAKEYLKRMTNGTLRDEMKGKPTKKTRFNSLSFD